ncbi:amidohydrolase family protein [Pararobbsia silviterrae]|uniref:amidohydrolase family protein n=1 Tax=Pararobbsia silviterrae TaxID=1792498 RepID=UPI0013143022|nr:amidohydrolase family protein [Pararobbsia silviterrae]
MSRRIIDTHPHIISPDKARYPITPLGGKRSAWSEQRPVDFPGLVREMDAAGIAKAAIVHSSTTYGYNAAYVADAIEGQRDRFAGVFSVDVLQPDAPAQIRHWVDRGLSGLRLFAAGSTVKSDPSWIADPRTYPAWEQCQTMDIPVALSIRQEALPHLLDVMSRYPGVRLILDHLLLSPIEDGAPYAASAPMFALARHPQVYLKLTTNNVRRAHDGRATAETFFGQLVDRFGSSRIMWGSNFPNEPGPLAQQVDEAKAALAFLPEKDQDNIFWQTAVALYPSLGEDATRAPHASHAPQANRT